jgi:hypothetical protein
MSVALHPIYDGYGRRLASRLSGQSAQTCNAVCEPWQRVEQVLVV